MGDFETEIINSVLRSALTICLQSLTLLSRDSDFSSNKGYGLFVRSSFTVISKSILEPFVSTRFLIEKSLKYLALSFAILSNLKSIKRTK